MRDPRLYKRANGYYYAIRETPDGPIWKSLGTKRKRVAQAKLKRLIDHQHGLDARPPLTLGAAYDAYYEAQTARATEATLDDLASTLEPLVQSIGRSVPLLALTTDQVAAAYQRKDLAAATQHGYYRRLKALLNWAGRQAPLPPRLVETLPVPPRPTTVPQYLTRSEYSAVDDHFATRRTWMQPVVRLAVSTGARISELEQLRWDDIDPDLGVLMLRGKGRKQRRVPLFPLAQRALDQCAPYDPVLGGPSGTGLSIYTASEAFKQAVRTLELPDAYHLHTLRHTFASWLVQDGIPLRQIQQWMGHSTITTTERYAHLQPTTFQEAAQTTFSLHDT